VVSVAEVALSSASETVRYSKFVTSDRAVAAVEGAEAALMTSVSFPAPPSTESVDAIVLVVPNVTESSPAPPLI